MLLQAVRVLECFAAKSAESMLGLVMRREVFIVLEMYITMLAIRMFKALNPVFFESDPGGEVDLVAIVTMTYYVVR